MRIVPRQKSILLCIFQKHIPISVVLYLDSTSNHNCIFDYVKRRQLYFIWILHQTTTRLSRLISLIWLYFIWILHQTTTWFGWQYPEYALYFIWILHQTTTRKWSTELAGCCTLFGFYIKPQHESQRHLHSVVVLYLDSTSNHNPTCYKPIVIFVVLYLDSTSNHNPKEVPYAVLLLYFIWILHQTTTTTRPKLFKLCCTLFGFYIKPQLAFCVALVCACCTLFGFYIKPQPLTSSRSVVTCCTLFGFYIKPQHKSQRHLHSVRCTLFGFYIKPQQILRKAGYEAVVLYLDSTSNHNINGE